ncbi:hypothetical protein GBAR_LOCUS2507 [Geodia barretti]|uniref:Uncharacterized protein n=1 Tax=Geodia barretti TaxID=519541 RepID=A0AA35R1E0_GEOBA|nr:hypothetical protein GBAR_LOCUS2507 [Geodia barretti]
MPNPRKSRRWQKKWSPTPNGATSITGDKQRRSSPTKKCSPRPSMNWQTAIAIATAVTPVSSNSVSAQATGPKWRSSNSSTDL